MCPECGELIDAEVESPGILGYEGESQKLLCKYNDNFWIYFYSFETAADAEAFYNYERGKSDEFIELTDPAVQDWLQMNYIPSDTRKPDNMHCELCGVNKCECEGGYFHDGTIAGHIYASVTQKSNTEDVTRNDVYQKIQSIQACMNGTEPEPEETNLQVNIADHPLKNMKVIIEDEEYTTNNEGMVTIPENGSVTLQFSYVDDNPYFSIYIDTEKHPFEVILTIKEGKIKKAVLYSGENVSFWPSKINLDLPIEDFDFNKIDDNPLIPESALRYIHFTEALEFYQELGVTFDKPVKIILGASIGKLSLPIPIKAVYLDYKIIMNKKATLYSNWRPFIEYHEFSHYAMNQMYGDDLFKEMTKSPNHGGFANPTTTDSWMEGFAAFMAVVIANHYDRWWAEGPLEKSPAGYPMAGSLDTNYRAWMYEGRAEEYAIASFLWDCIDSEEKKFNAKGVWSLASGQVFGDYFFDDWDHNNDGIATREEISIGVLLMLFGDPIDSVIYPPNIILIAGVTEDLGDFDIEPDMNIFETYDDGDDILNEDELENMAEIIDNGYYQKPYKIADKWIELYDDDGNGNISLEEAKKILKVHEIIMDLQGKNSTADWDDIKTWLDSEYLAPFMGKLINKFCMGLPDDGWTRDEFDSYILKNVTREDDDYTNWSFEKLWGEVLSRKHKDFSSVLYWFPIENEEERKDLFWLLRLHGMYQKKLKGNGVYDSGEAYNDTNNNQNWDPGEPFIDYPPTWTISPGDIYGSPSNYQRIGRNSTPYFKGQYIKTPDGEYDISYIIMNGFNITDVIVYSAESEDGMLYVPIPPESFIGIFETNKRDKGPLVTFSSNYFNTNYEEIIERGYITSIENKNDMNNDPNIPLGMIAILLVICTILIGVFIKIKKKKEK